LGKDVVVHPAVDHVLPVVAVRRKRVFLVEAGIEDVLVHIE
jgi:hypothetical protein